MTCVEARFWSKVRIVPRGCWEWQRSVNNKGYGQFSALGEHGAHRVAYRLAYGAIPPGRQVHHICENKRCVKPAHLAALTPRENTLLNGSPVAVNAAKTRCVRGHALTNDNLVPRKNGARQCRTCSRDYERERWRTRKYGKGARMGNIGEPKREIEFEPMPTEEPAQEPAAPTPAPAEPVPAGV